MRGPAPLPTAIKEFRGNPGKRPLNHDEPKPELVDGLPQPPKWLKGEAKREWNRVLPYLTGTKVLAKLDTGPLATYCLLHAEVVKAARKGEIPTAAVISQYRSLAGEFGMTPSSRSRIKVGNVEEKDSEKRFFGT